MEITKQFLLDEIQKVKKEQEEWVMRAQVAEGFLMCYNRMLSKLDEKDDAMSLEQLKDTIGADSVEVCKT